MPQLPLALLCMCPEIEQGSWTLSSQPPGPAALMKVSVRLPILMLSVCWMGAASLRLLGPHTFLPAWQKERPSGR